MKTLSSSQRFERIHDHMENTYWHIIWAMDGLPEGRTLEILKALEVGMKLNKKTVKEEIAALMRAGE